MTGANGRSTKLLDKVINVALVVPTSLFLIAVIEFLRWRALRHDRKPREK